MKIAILTLPLHTNYGGILQAYALQTVLKRMGHEVVVLDKQRFYLPLWRKPLSYSKRIAKKYFLGKTDVCIFSEQKNKREYPILSQYTQPFIEKHISSIHLKRLAQLPKNNFDMIVVGSDQIWRPLYAEGMWGTSIQNIFLQFTKNWNIKRIAYATSFGSEKWEYTEKQTFRCKKMLAYFEAISVREQLGVTMCKEHFNKEATHVLDPTMLLTIADYEELIKKIPTEQTKGELLTYILDKTEDKENAKNKVMLFGGYTSFSVNNDNTENKNIDIKQRIAPPVESWIKGFFDAKFVITDSFHACVFSILFKKPFFVYVNKERGAARFKSLLSLFELESRMIFSSDELTDEKIQEEINWITVFEKLKSEKQKSIQFLTNALS